MTVILPDIHDLAVLATTSVDFPASWTPTTPSRGFPREPDVPELALDHRYADSDVVGPFTAVHTPGHTPNHHSLVDEDVSLAVLGDAAFGSDARGLPTEYFVLPIGFYSVDLDAADESLARLLDYEFEGGLLYHGSSVREGVREKLEAFVDFQGKPE